MKSSSRKYVHTEHEFDELEVSDQPKKKRKRETKASNVEKMMASIADFNETMKDSKREISIMESRPGWQHPIVSPLFV